MIPIGSIITLKSLPTLPTRAPVNALALKVAGSERKAFKLQRLGQFEKAIDLLENLIADPDLKQDAQRRAWLAATAARIAYQMGEDDRGQKLQTHAFSVSNNHSPPKVRPSYVARPIPGKQSAAIIERMLEYDLRGAMLADFDEAVSELVPTASAARYEEALSNLGASWVSSRAAGENLQKRTRRPLAHRRDVRFRGSRRRARRRTIPSTRTITLNSWKRRLGSSRSIRSGIQFGSRRFQKRSRMRRRAPLAALRCGLTISTSWLDRSAACLSSWSPVPERRTRYASVARRRW